MTSTEKAEILAVLSDLLDKAPPFGQVGVTAFLHQDRVVRIAEQSERTYRTGSEA